MRYIFTPKLVALFTHGFLQLFCLLEDTISLRVKSAVQAAIRDKSEFIAGYLLCEAFPLKDK
jgi:hypothetical protein